MGSAYWQGYLISLRFCVVIMGRVKRETRHKSEVIYFEGKSIYWNMGKKGSSKRQREATGARGNG